MGTAIGRSTSPSKNFLPGKSPRVNKIAIGKPIIISIPTAMKAMEKDSHIALWIFFHSKFPSNTSSKSLSRISPTLPITLLKILMIGAAIIMIKKLITTTSKAILNSFLEK